MYFHQRRSLGFYRSFLLERGIGFETRRNKRYYIDLIRANGIAVEEPRLVKGTAEWLRKFMVEYGLKPTRNMSKSAMKAAIQASEYNMPGWKLRDEPFDWSLMKKLSKGDCSGRET